MPRTSAITSGKNLNPAAAKSPHAPSKFKPWEKMLAKVWDVVWKILLGLGNALFFLTNPTLYAISFCVGFVFSKQVQLVIDKIVILWKKYPWQMAIGVGVAGFLDLQISWASTSVLFGAHLGATLSEKAYQFLNPRLHGIC